MSRTNGLAGIDELEQVACALCGGTAGETVLTGGDLRRGLPGRFTLVRCAECGLIYQNPRPTALGIQPYYPTDYEPHQVRKPSPLEAIYYRLFRALPVLPGSRVLDVGCAGGRYLLHLRGRGYRVAAVEPNERVVEELRQRFDLDAHPGMIWDPEFPDASFDVVTLWWVLEHTHEPRRVLSEALRLLRPGGWILVGLQNFDSLARRIFGPYWHHLDLPGHLYHFDPTTLSALLTDVGFRNVQTRQDPVAKDFAPSLRHRLGGPAWLEGTVANALALPFDLLAWTLGRSGLMTTRARRPEPNERAGGHS